MALQCTTPSVTNRRPLSIVSLLIPAAAAEQLGDRRGPVSTSGSVRKLVEQGAHELRDALSE